jgi:hypothetical protein
MNSNQNTDTTNHDTTKYAIAFIDVEPGDRRIQLNIKAEDTELALEVMKEMETQGQTSGVTPTKRKFGSNDVTSKKTLLEMLDVAKKLREFKPSNPS